MRFPYLSLSAKLLILSMLLVMITQILICVPLIARYRYEWLSMHINEAHIIFLAAPTYGNGIGTNDIVFNYINSYAIAIRQNDELTVFPNQEMPPVIDAYFELWNVSYFTLIKDALALMVHQHNRIIEVHTQAPWDPTISLSMIMNEHPLYEDITNFMERLIILTFFSSLIVAGLIYFLLNRSFIYPMHAMIKSMILFHHNPNNPEAIMSPNQRNDELGIAQHELASMQATLLTALRQKERLATLGTAVAKINHDLSNILQSALLLSERLIKSDDPAVLQVLPRLIISLDRATELCTQILSYSRDGVFPLRRSTFSLAVLVDEVGADILALQHKYINEHRYVKTTDLVWTTQVAPEMIMYADRGQLARALMNLGRNALQAGATQVDVTAEIEEQYLHIIVSDNGSGLSSGAQEDLFQPFAGTMSGTGLGLAIAREILRAHGGDLRLLDPITMTISASTAFVMELPADVIILEKDK